VGQGSNAGGDYSTPIRNSIVLFMNGPAVEIAALDSHIPMQLQAEAQQKQCDYILLSSVAVKHSSGGGFGRFAKMAAPVASMVPMAGMAGGMGGAVAAQAAGAAASAAAMSAQQQIAHDIAHERVGMELKLLVDQPHFARGEGDAPDVDARVVLSKAAPVGEFIWRRITGSRGYDMLA